MTTFQPMPELTSDQYDALRTDIEKNGILVPVVHDQHGRTLDGHNREAIGRDLGIDVPVEVVNAADDDEAATLALTLNCARRHLTREQVREVIALELQRRPDDSDRTIAKRVGCSPSTVGAVRRGGSEVSNLDTPLTDAQRASLREAEGIIEDSLRQARAALFSTVTMALINHITVPECVGALTMARLRWEQQHRETDTEVVDVFRRMVFDYVAEVTTWPETAEEFPPHPDSSPTPDERALLLDNIVSVGGDVEDSVRTDAP